MVNYGKTKIYKIYSHCGNLVYIDATTKEYLSQRFQQHKNEYKKYIKNDGKFTNLFGLFEMYDVEKCKIELIEMFPCSNKDEKTARVRYHKEILKELEVDYITPESEILKQQQEEEQTTDYTDYLKQN